MILKSGFYLHTGWQHVYKEEEKELCDSNVSREVIIQYLHTRTHTQPPHTHIRTRTRAHTRALVYYFIFSHLKKKREKNLISKKEGECVYRGSMCAFGPSPYFCLPG